MSDVVIYGNGQVAGLAKYYFEHDSDHQVVAFTVEERFLSATTFEGLPLVPLGEVVERFPPSSFAMFVGMGYGRVNRDREERFLQMKELGYSLVSYVSSHAIVWPGVEIGENCLILEGNIIQPFVRIGNDVTMWSGCHVGHETIIEDHCFLSAHSVVSGNVTVESHSFLGVNASIRNSITIRTGSVIGAGVTVMKDTKERGVYPSPRAELLPMPSDRLPGL